MRIRLSERDLNRIIRKVLNEGVVIPIFVYKAENANDVTVSCGQSSAPGAPVQGPYISGGSNNKAIPLTGEMYSFFC